MGAGRQVSLNITAFSLESHVDCRYDYLEIRYHVDCRYDYLEIRYHVDCR